MAPLVRRRLPQGLDDARRGPGARPLDRGRRPHAAGAGRRLPDGRPGHEGRERGRLHVPQAREAPRAGAAQGVAGQRARGRRHRPDRGGPPGGHRDRRPPRAGGRDPLLRLAAGGDARRPGAREVPQDVRERDRDLRRVPDGRLPGRHRDRLLRRHVEEVARGRAHEQPGVPEGPPVRPRGGQLGPSPGPVALGPHRGPAALAAVPRGRGPGLHALRGLGDVRRRATSCRAS